MLLIDNASSNGHVEDTSSLSNMEVGYLPKNTTSFLQLFDGAVIASLKKDTGRSNMNVLYY